MTVAEIEKRILNALYVDIKENDSFQIWLEEGLDGLDMDQDYEDDEDDKKWKAFNKNLEKAKSNVIDMFAKFVKEKME